ncbi:helix-turn-helix domain-containing protein [Actinomycetospora termitidis]|uniref:Helix-turn-helix domain-containing protein n=1 Tax=Actinomycetospora termitidis TaxID=3053470 RepID=A0ABT7M121_9PSEU|nr:helix-turn-helix domain-containing protein [Actinomycetospora sp. Odt1-22]MDL5154356.1 helix-turn-helix domain-containing protein [Actinomycetospora sp. Odt1-22]
MRHSVGRRTQAPTTAPRPGNTREVAAVLAAAPPPARDREAGAEAAAMIRWARVEVRAAALAAELDTREAASRLVSLLTRLGVTDGTVRADSASDRWRVEVRSPEVPGTTGDALTVRLGLTDARGRALTAPPAWLTGGSLPGAVATWRGALLARGRLSEHGVVLECPTPGAALTLAELGLRLGVRARREASRVVVDRSETALLLTTCGGRSTAAAAGLEDPGRSSANDARATVAASRTTTATEEAFATLERAGVEVPDALADAGRLRLAHPELGLPELAARADPPLSKDALAGRLRRLAALAARHR